MKNIFLLLTLITVLGCKEKSAKELFAKQLMSNSDKIETGIQDEVKLQLAYPEECEFKEKPIYSLVSLKDKRSRITGFVIAKNAFGVKSRVYYEALVTIDGSNANIESVKIDKKPIY